MSYHQALGRRAQAGKAVAFYTVWMVTHMSSSKINKAVKSCTNDKGKPANLSDLFGNNAFWYIPTSAEDAP
ncbi:hypothetical protein [Scytonema sp. HK-05]|uniref:hypothetical protein n=1 Tax=Scytonema sp. HK-05 TaxID=1137095 RepID=UPI000936BD1C|nr:hypothetical protein [Scytonema sp. HK-05]OKH57514.1 hypothetical protein NIES2130_19800 [Scytonema sp. HK-05]